MRRRATYQVITEVKASPVGVDWLMIIAAKQTGQRQRYSQKQVSERPMPDKLEKQIAHAY